MAEKIDFKKEYESYKKQANLRSFISNNFAFIRERVNEGDSLSEIFDVAQAMGFIKKYNVEEFRQAYHRQKAIINAALRPKSADADENQAENESEKPAKKTKPVKDEQPAQVVEPEPVKTKNVDKAAKETMRAFEMQTPKQKKMDLIDQITSKVHYGDLDAQNFSNLLETLTTDELEPVAKNFKNLKEKGSGVVMLPGLFLERKNKGDKYVKQVFLALATGKKTDPDVYHLLSEEMQKIVENAVYRQDSILVDLKAN